MLDNIIVWYVPIWNLFFFLCSGLHEVYSFSPLGTQRHVSLPGVNVILLSVLSVWRLFNLLTSARMLSPFRVSVCKYTKPQMHIYNSTHCRIPCWEIFKVLCKTWRGKCAPWKCGWSQRSVWTLATESLRTTVAADFCRFHIDSVWKHCSGIRRKHRLMTEASLQTQANPG